MYMTGRYPKGEIDHIDGDSENNSISNLRVVDRKTNCMNTGLQAASVSGFCGVNWHEPSGKWRARVKVDGSEKYIGLFDDPEEAAKEIKAVRDSYGFHDNHGKPIQTEREKAIEEMYFDLTEEVASHDEMMDDDAYANCETLVSLGYRKC